MWQIPIEVLYAVFFICFFIAAFFFLIFLESKFRKKEPKERFYENITFVIPCFNAADVLESAVNSIKKSDYPQEKIKIILVNDGSSDNTLKVAESLKKRYNNIVVLSKKNEGSKASALNFGLKRAVTPLVAVLDADTILEKNLLIEAVAKFSDKNIMGSACRMKPLNNFGLIEKLQYIEYTFSGFYRMMMGRINAFSIAPAFTVIRRAFLVKHGYFEVGNLTEDLEMGMRIQSKHYDVCYIGDTIANTYVPDSLKKLSRQRMRWAYGTFQNYYKYRKMFFNWKYGDLGLFILPAGFISILLLSSVLLMFFYTTINWIMNHISMLSAGWLPTLDIDISDLMFSLTEPRIILFALSILIGLAFFYMIKSEFNEKIKLPEYVLYITVYVWFLAIIYIATLFCFIAKRKVKW